MKNWLLKIIINRLLKKRRAKLTYSQSGEDLLVAKVFGLLSIDRPSYLDIGAFHPFRFSNTALLYDNGSSGVCIEPNPHLFTVIKKNRPRDICLNAGIGIDDRSEADFYVMSTPTLSTFSKDEAERYCSYGKQKIEKIIRSPLISFNKLIVDYAIKVPDFVSVDVEGLDYEILESINFEKYRPAVFCVETLTYTENSTEVKIDKIISYMESQGYFVYADTHLNTIFVDSAQWQKRQN